jgi:hypothetical protein
LKKLESHGALMAPRFISGKKKPLQTQRLKSDVGSRSDKSTSVNTGNRLKTGINPFKSGCSSREGSGLFALKARQE